MRYHQTPIILLCSCFLTPRAVLNENKTTIQHIHDIEFRHSTSRKKTSTCQEATCSRDSYSTDILFTKTLFTTASQFIQHQPLLNASSPLFSISSPKVPTFRRTAAKYSINGFFILLKPDDLHRESFVANSGGGSRK